METTERNRDQVLGTETRKLICKLTTDEIDAKRAELGDYPERIDDTEKELDRAKEDWKTEKGRLEGKIATLQAEQKQLIRIVSRGADRREVKVERVGDYQTSMVRYERTDTREVVESRPMRDSERQAELALQTDDTDEELPHRPPADTPPIDDEDSHKDHTCAECLDYGNCGAIKRKLCGPEDEACANLWLEGRDRPLLCGLCLPFQNHNEADPPTPGRYDCPSDPTIEGTRGVMRVTGACNGFVEGEMPPPAPHSVAPEVLAETQDHGTSGEPQDLPQLAQDVIAAKYGPASELIRGCDDAELLREVLAAEQGMRKPKPRERLMSVIRNRIETIEKEAKASEPTPTGHDLGDGLKETVPAELADKEGDEDPFVDKGTDDGSESGKLF